MAIQNRPAAGVPRTAPGSAQPQQSPYAQATPYGQGFQMYGQPAPQAPVSQGGVQPQPALREDLLGRLQGMLGRTQVPPPAGPLMPTGPGATLPANPQPVSPRPTMPMPAGPFMPTGPGLQRPPLGSHPGETPMFFWQNGQLTENSDFKPTHLLSPEQRAASAERRQMIKDIPRAANRPRRP